jgi:RNA polymerase sigma-70 factor (ECF subfamily)
MTALATDLAPSPAMSFLDRAAGGEEAAFGAIIREHQSMVYGIAWNFSRNRALAEELAQEAFLQLYRNLGTIESEQHLIFWLRRVTANLCIDQARRGHERLVGISECAEPSVAPRTSDPFALRRVEKLLPELPPIQRLVVTLRYQEDLTPTEIAELIRIPANTVKSHLRRALSFLRARIESRSRV